jgi:hypothetical protein
MERAYGRSKGWSSYTLKLHRAHVAIGDRRRRRRQIHLRKQIISGPSIWSSATLQVKLGILISNRSFRLCIADNGVTTRRSPAVRACHLLRSVKMPVTIPPADLYATNSRSTHYQGHQRLRDEEDAVGLAPQLASTGLAGDKLVAEGDVSKYATTEGQDDDDYSAKADQAGQGYPSVRETSIKGKAQRLMQVLVKHGVEARATEPVPEEVSRLHARIALQSSYVPGFSGKSGTQVVVTRPAIHSLGCREHQHP